MLVRLPYFKKMSKKVFFFVISLLLVTTYQSTISQTVRCNRVKEKITLDGILDETDWKNSETLPNFSQFKPEYGKKSDFITITKFLYNDEMMYIGFDCKDSFPSRITSKITKRDGDLDNDDNIIIYLDTYCDKSNAYYFSVNPFGTQRDGRIADNGNTIDPQWDETWYSAVSINNDGWSGEIGIPFKSIKYNSKGGSWGINVGRNVARILETSYSSGALTSQNRVSQFGILSNLELSELVVKRYSIIPYTQLKIQESSSPEAEAGINVRYNLSSNIGVEATINPDFATIEGDVEQINLTRFELSYPEKRPFFMEGAENYSTRIKQFYSRRIGGIPWGAKLNGKVNDMKFNALFTQSDPSSAGGNELPGEKALYSVFRVNREFANGSNIGIIGANRSYANCNSGSGGLASTLFFNDVFGMTSQFVKSYGAYNDDPWTYFIRPSFDTQFSHFHVRYSYVGVGVKANMNKIGYLQDDDRKEFDTNVKHALWINNYGFESIEASVNFNKYWSQTGVLRSWNVDPSVKINFIKKWSYTLEYIDEYKRYEKDFRNHQINNNIRYDNKQGLILNTSYRFGNNYDSEFEILSGSVQINLMDGLNFEYQFDKTWFHQDMKADNNWIHYLRTSYYFNNDLYLKLFYQTKYSLEDKFRVSDFDLERKTIQLAFVWRFLPPFGAIQIVYQEGCSRISETENTSTSVFTKLSWVL